MNAIQQLYRPLDPIFNLDKLFGSIIVGNTPPYNPPTTAFTQPFLNPTNTWLPLGRYFTFARDGATLGPNSTVLETQSAFSSTWTLVSTPSVAYKSESVYASTVSGSVIAFADAGDAAFTDQYVTGLTTGVVPASATTAPLQRVFIVAMTTANRTWTSPVGWTPITPLVGQPFAVWVSPLNTYPSAGMPIPAATVTASGAGFIMFRAVVDGAIIDPTLPRLVNIASPTSGTNTVFIPHGADPGDVLFCQSQTAAANQGLLVQGLADNNTMFLAQMLRAPTKSEQGVIGAAAVASISSGTNQSRPISYLLRNVKEMPWRSDETEVGIALYPTISIASKPSSNPGLGDALVTQAIQYIHRDDFIYGYPGSIDDELTYGTYESDISANGTRRLIVQEPLANGVSSTARSFGNITVRTPPTASALTQFFERSNTPTRTTVPYMVVAQRANAATSGTSITPAARTCSPGEDCLFIAIHVRVATTVTPPAGWTLLTIVTSSVGDGQQHVFYRIPTNVTETGHTFTLGSSQTYGYEIFLVRDIDQTTPVSTIETLNNGSVSAPPWTPAFSFTPGDDAVGTAFFASTSGGSVSIGAQAIVYRQRRWVEQQSALATGVRAVGSVGWARSGATPLVQWGGSISGPIGRRLETLLVLNGITVTL